MKNTISIIGGAGHIGLPLSCLISNQGIPTIIIDNNEVSIEKIQKLRKNYLVARRTRKYGSMDLHIKIAQKYQLAFGFKTRKCITCYRFIEKTYAKI